MPLPVCVSLFVVVLFWKTDFNHSETWKSSLMLKQEHTEILQSFYTDKIQQISHEQLKDVTGTVGYYHNDLSISQIWEDTKWIWLIV